MNVEKVLNGKVKRITNGKIKTLEINEGTTLQSIIKQIVSMQYIIAECIISNQYKFVNFTNNAIHTYFQIKFPSKGENSNIYNVYLELFTKEHKLEIWFKYNIKKEEIEIFYLDVY